MTRIVQVSSPTEVEAVAALLREYAASLGLDLGFQGFSEELAGLPGDYTPPRGALFLALDDGVAVGCVGLRPLAWPRIAELKRLYVRPHDRGHGLGTLLSQAALSVAREAGYRLVRLDTLPTMLAARRLYKALGFSEIEAYRFNPVPGTRYMELVLNPSDGEQ
jgi:ribosomal protein S18 acetylase RimI-like enzyme